jgi:hypothetical protein
MKILNLPTKKQSSLFQKVLSIFIMCLSFSQPGYSHRGPVDEIDNCRIKVGFEKIHFSAYTPEITRGQSFCQSIPNVGLTNLVFDYEGKKLRDVSIEFEVTKEPEGTRIYYQPPEKIKTGTVNARIDFAKHGAGDYLAHVTIVHKGEKLDTHLSFSVGVEVAETPWSLYFSLLIFVVLVVAYIMLYRANKLNNKAASDKTA